MEQETDQIALIDLDGTVADYDKSFRQKMVPLLSPSEEMPMDRYTYASEPPHMEARRKLIQSVPGFWRDLEVIEMGMEVVEEIRKIGFEMHILTKGPKKCPLAWGEKVEWCQKHIPDAIPNVTSKKSLVYGRVLVDDFEPYFEKWLAVRPRGLVVCVAQSWNIEYAEGGAKERPNVLRYDGSNRKRMRELLKRAFSRGPRENLHYVEMGAQG